MVPADVIELLLPDAPARTAEHARTLIVFLRLLAADGRAASARDAQLDAERARAELARLDAQARTRALEDLLAHACTNAQGDEGWAQHADPKRSAHDAWRVLLESESSADRLELPRPGESALELAARLHAALVQQLGAAHARCALWSAQLERLRSGPAVAAPLFERAFTAARAAGAAPADCAALLAGQAACLLERGAPRAARALLENRLECVALDAGLARLLGASLLALGEERAAAEFLRAGGAAPRWPASAVQLGCELESARTWFGSSAEGSSARASDARHESADARPLPLSFGRERADFGALAFAVLALGPQGEGRLVTSELAPGARAHESSWREARELAWRRAGEAEHELAAHARALRWQRAGEAVLRGAADAERVRALALEPIFGPLGELAGCVRLELEHHLLPSPARMRALAGAWREEVLAALEESRGAAAQEERGDEASAPASSDARVAQLAVLPFDAIGAADGSSAAALRALADSLGMRLAQRRWWGFELERGRLRCVASEGGALADWQARPGGARALERSRACLAPVRFEEPSARLSIHADAAAGLVLPVLVRERACAWLALESTRKRDFRELDLRRCLPLVAAHAVALRRAQFADWHALAHGQELCTSEPAALGLELEHVRVYAQATRPIALCGPAGSGKRVLARWLHFESTHAQGAWRELGCFGLGARALEASLLGGRCAGVLLAGLHELPMPAQLQLVRLLERAPARLPRLHASLPTDLRSAAASGALRTELAAAFVGLELRVAPLGERRAAIPALAQHAVSRHARAERRAEPSWSDAALAGLWRQDWPGNLRQLEHVAYRLGLLAGGGTIDEALLASVARALGLELRARCDSRTPASELVRAALELTRKQSGAWNKTRAALYLGWDPDTLVLRMREAGLELDGCAAARVDADAAAGAEAGSGAPGTAHPSADAAPSELF